MLEPENYSLDCEVYFRAAANCIAYPSCFSILPNSPATIENNYNRIIWLDAVGMWGWWNANEWSTCRFTIIISTMTFAACSPGCMVWYAQSKPDCWSASFQHRNGPRPTKLQIITFNEIKNKANLIKFCLSMLILHTAETWTSVSQMKLPI